VPRVFVDRSWHDPSPLPTDPYALLSIPFAFGEELGWRGYAQEKFVGQFGMFGGLLLLGVLWGFWHTPIFYFMGVFGTIRHDPDRQHLGGHSHGYWAHDVAFWMNCDVSRDSRVSGEAYNEGGQFVVMLQ
jgi:hypothetical protein